MTRKVYKSAMGKPVDLGALLLQNEQVKAVGNMGVNAAGDLVDSTNKVIDQRNRQVQRQYRRQTNVMDIPVSSGTLSARREKKEKIEENQKEEFLESGLTTNEEPELPAQESNTSDPGAGGLAAAIARQREIKQELEKTLRQRKQEQGIKKI